MTSKKISETRDNGQLDVTRDGRKDEAIAPAWSVSRVLPAEMTYGAVMDLLGGSVKLVCTSECPL